MQCSAVRRQQYAGGAMPQRLRVCVLGAGVVGLHAALRLQRDFPQARVTILAAGQLEDTCSIGAAGLFRPGYFHTTSPQLTEWVLDESWRHYRAVLNSEEAAAAGVMEVSGFMFTRRDASVLQNAHLQRLCPDFRAATERELRLCPGDWKHGVFFTTMLIDCTYHLKWLTQRFLQAGGRLEERLVTSFDELQDHDVVVNCTGLGARQLCADRRMVPIRGQVIKVKAPWIKTFFYAEDNCYIIPGADGVTLGGTRQFSDADTQVRDADTSDIWTKCTALVPSLKRAEVVRHWVGLRPHRDPVRLQKQRLASGLCVLHCYGHGGYGVMTAPGSAAHVSTMLAQVLHGDYANPAVSSL